MAAHFKPVVNAIYELVAPPLTRRTAISGYPKVASYDVMDEQLHYSNPVKHGSRYPFLLSVSDSESETSVVEKFHNHLNDVWSQTE